MANHCSNWVEIEGSEEQVKKFFELVGKDFDFNKIIPTETDSRDEANEKWNCTSIAFDVECDYEDGDWQAGWFFWTKWNPPTLIYDKLCELFDEDLYIVWRYEERGMGLYGYLNAGDC